MRACLRSSLGSLVLPFFLLAAPLAAGELRPPLDRVLDETAPGTLVPVSVVLEEQVSRERVRLARAGLSGDEARGAVIRELKRTALATQGPLLEQLRVASLDGRAARIRPLWIGNIVGVDATPELIRRIAERPEVGWINHNPKVDVFLERPQPTKLGAAAPAPGYGTDAVECGTELMRAPEVWNDFGITGEGAVIAVIDTGVCWSHPDIVNQVWVNPGEDLDGDGEVMDADDANGIDDDGNGFVDDFVGWDFDQNDNDPDDDNSHGSHVAGTVAGDGTSGTQAGMAPDAKVMIVRVGVTFADEVDVWNGMQYAADNGADSISMSLGWPHNQNPDRATWRQNCENTIDAGTAMVIAAGNEGSGTAVDNVRTPGDVPRIISVGATDCNDNAAGFSSRGPVTWQGVDPYNDHPYPPGLIKPDISAPGVSTQSHNYCSGYSSKSGTSMATPHVAGAVALMVSANPGLTHDEIKETLELTSIDMGAGGKDNTFGSGRVDAWTAVDEVFGLAIEDITIDDSDPDQANGDTGTDTGELVTMIISLRNRRDDRTATNVTGFLETATPGVTTGHDFGSWPDIGPSGVESSSSPHFSVRIDEGCNFPVDFQLTLRHDGREVRRRFSIRVGSPFERDLLIDDFEGDQGWTVSGDPTGAFERGDPVGYADGGGAPVQPEDDTTTDPGAVCFVTHPGQGQLDGMTIVTSPPMDATDFADADFSYNRWFYAFPATTPASDFYRTQWSTDGTNWTNVEEISQTDNAWQSVSLPVPPSALTDGLRFRLQVEDLAVPSLVEALIDDVVIRGHRIECDSFTPPPAAAPNPVGPTLIVDADGNDVRLDWDEPPVDGGHDAATRYRVYTSSSPDSGFDVDGLSTEPWHVDANGMDTASGTIYYKIVAVNGGGPANELP